LRNVFSSKKPNESLEFKITLGSWEKFRNRPIMK